MPTLLNPNLCDGQAWHRLDANGVGQLTNHTHFLEGWLLAMKKIRQGAKVQLPEILSDERLWKLPRRANRCDDPADAKDRCVLREAGQHPDEKDRHAYRDQWLGMLYQPPSDPTHAFAETDNYPYASSSPP